METFKTIPNYPDYQVSNYGNVKTFRTKCNKEFGMLLKIGKDFMGYQMVKLFNDTVIKGKVFKVHRLVLDAFGDMPGMFQNCVNHKDGNKSNNHIDNLESCTQQENVTHAIATGAKPRMCTRNETRAVIITDVFGAEVFIESVGKAAKYLKVSVPAIYNAARGYQKSVKKCTVRYAD